MAFFVNVGLGLLSILENKAEAEWDCCTMCVISPPQSSS